MALLTQQQLAKTLGKTDRCIRLWVQDGMPRVGEGAEAMYDEGACRAWAARRGKTVAEGPRPEAAPLPPAPSPAPAQHAGPVVLEGQPHGGALLRHRLPPDQRTSPVALAAELAKLRHPSAPPTERAEAALVAASFALADKVASEEGAVGRDFDSFRTTLDGLRQAEAAYLELEQERGTLIGRDVAMAVMGQIARRFVLALERLEVRAASQVELWLNDAAFRALDSDARGRVVRAWVQTQTRQARLGESEPAAAEEIARLVRVQVEERRGA